MKLNIGIFLGSKFGKGENFNNLVKDLSKLINQTGHNVIYGGTETGLMGELVKNVNDKIKVTAIITKKLINDHNDLKYFSELIITKNLKQRTDQFILKSDVFIALPGWIGTLYEFIEIVNKRILEETTKKIYLINENNYWQPLIKLFKHMVNEKFLNKQTIFESFEIIKFNELEERLKNGKNFC